MKATLLRSAWPFLFLGASPLRIYADRCAFRLHLGWRHPERLQPRGISRAAPNIMLLHARCFGAEAPQQDAYDAGRINASGFRKGMASAMPFGMRKGAGFSREGRS